MKTGNPFRRVVAVLGAISAALASFGRGAERLQSIAPEVRNLGLYNKRERRRGRQFGPTRTARTGTVARDRRRAQKARNRKRNRRAHK